MSSQLKSKLKKLNLISLLVPLSLLVTSGLFPLKPFVQQAFVCILLIWFQATAILSFNIWFQ